MEAKIIEQLNRIEQYTLLSAKNVLSLEDVAILTGMSRSYLYKLTCTHQIPHYKLNGKTLYFDRKEIEDWMKQSRVATVQEIEEKAATYVAIGRMKKGGLK